jgi:Flp pilus assembly protein CpaB
MLALTLALLTGLGAVVAARYAGWLSKPEPPKPEEVKKEEKKEIQVLVAARNVFPGDVIETGWVRTRALRPEEIAEYEKNKDHYLPATPPAAALRVAKVAIEAETPILRTHLEDLIKPDPLNKRLLPNMRAVNIAVEKDASAGGLIQAGEWVDVHLTSTITNGDQTTTRTAVVASSVRVIAKRNALWTIFQPLPDNKPVNFTLEANPYRAALIEYAKSKGALSMVPVSAAERRSLEERRNKVLKAGDPKVLPISFAQPGSADSNGEETRVEMFARGEYSIGHGDLIRIFDLTTPPPPRSDIVVEHFTAVKRTKVERFDASGQFISSEDVRRSRPGSAPKAASPSTSNVDFQFTDPAAGLPKKCKTCKKSGS